THRGEHGGEHRHNGRGGEQNGSVHARSHAGAGRWIVRNVLHLGCTSITSVCPLSPSSVRSSVRPSVPSVLFLCVLVTIRPSEPVHDLHGPELRAAYQHASVARVALVGDLHEQIPL